MVSAGSIFRGLWLVAVAVWSLSAVGSGSLEDARFYQEFIVRLRQLIGLPYRDQTSVVSGSRIMSFLPLGPLVGGVATSAELVVSHRDGYTLGYRVREGDQRVMYLFSDSDPGFLTAGTDYDRLERLGFGSTYLELERTARTTRENVRLTVHSLRECIARLEQQATNEQRSQCLLQIVLAVSEGARFRDIFDNIYYVIRNDGTSNPDTTWRPTDQQVRLINSWGGVSRFIVRNTENPGSGSEWVPNLNQTVSMPQALFMLFLLQRCFDTQKGPRRRRQFLDPQEECGNVTAVDAAMSDGANSVYLFNGPNFVNVRFTPGTTDDRIVGGVRSIYNDWPFLRGTPFVNGIDSAFRVPGSNNAYIFKGGDYALIDVVSRSIINGPNSIFSSWHSLRDTLFVNGIDAVFASVREPEIYLFRSNQYALVDYAPGTTDDRIINGPNEIRSSWPSLRDTSYANGFDSAFSRPDVPEVYLFKGKEYLLMNYAPGTSDDRIINGPNQIRDGWPSLRGSPFDI